MTVYPRTKESVLTEISQIENRKKLMIEKYSMVKAKLDRREKETIDSFKKNMQKKRQKLESEETETLLACDSEVQKLKTKWKKVLERAD